MDADHGPGRVDSGRLARESYANKLRAFARVQREDPEAFMRSAEYLTSEAPTGADARLATWIFTAYEEMRALLNGPTLFDRDLIRDTADYDVERRIEHWVRTCEIIDDAPLIRTMIHPIVRLPHGR